MRFPYRAALSENFRENFIVNLENNNTSSLHLKIILPYGASISFVLRQIKNFFVSRRFLKKVTYYFKQLLCLRTLMISYSNCLNIIWSSTKLWDLTCKNSFSFGLKKSWQPFHKNHFEENQFLKNCTMFQPSSDFEIKKIEKLVEQFSSGLLQLEFARPKE